MGPIEAIMAQINESLTEPLSPEYSRRMAETIMALADKYYAPEFRGAVRVVLLPVQNARGSDLQH